MILGHCERRQLFGETDEAVNRKVRAALARGPDAILCVGETLAEREAGKTRAWSSAQLDAGLAGVAAGELGASRSPTSRSGPSAPASTATPGAGAGGPRLPRARVARGARRAVADAVRIQYGGSVKPDNIAS